MCMIKHVNEIILRIYKTVYSVWQQPKNRSDQVNEQDLARRETRWEQLSGSIIRL